MKKNVEIYLVCYFIYYPKLFVLIFVLPSLYLLSKIFNRLSRKFWSAENSGLGDRSFWNIGPPQTEIFEKFGPIMEKWSTHLFIKSAQLL